MVHPATRRAAMAAVRSIPVPIDIGFVYPPRTEGDRGRGVWTGRDLKADDVARLLDRAAAANVGGAQVFVRLGPSCRSRHPGIIMLDDVDADTIGMLNRDGLEPMMVIETSPGNHQCWIRLVEDDIIDYDLVLGTLRYLADAYGTDPRAVSPLQPGRLPGFTNRKPKYRSTTGSYPFVRLLACNPSQVATNGRQLLGKTGGQGLAQAGRAGALTPETPPLAAPFAGDIASDVATKIEAIALQQSSRIAAELAAGRRPCDMASRSEVDFAIAREALSQGLTPENISGWLAANRSEKGVRYADRTVRAAQEFVSFRKR